jgi:hypothetical protein
MVTRKSSPAVLLLVPWEAWDGNEPAPVLEEGGNATSDMEICRNSYAERPMAEISAILCNIDD